jgi:hypothetical protein
MSAKDSYEPPQEVRDEAKRALKWISEGFAGSGFTGVGRARARDLASGRSISVDTMRRMSSYFARHEVDKQGKGWGPDEKGYPSAGRVAWAAWGGDPGRKWVSKMLSNISEVKHDITKEQIDEYLAHYGVKGQQWGVRRTQKQLALGRSVKNNKGKTKFKEKGNRLTDEELSARIKRLETEKRYNELNKRQVSSGVKHINDVLVKIGKNSAETVGTKATVFAVKKLIEKKYNKQVVADMFPKKG